MGGVVDEMEAGFRAGAVGTETVEETLLVGVDHGRRDDEVAGTEVTFGAVLDRVRVLADEERRQLVVDRPEDVADLQIGDPAS